MGFTPTSAPLNVSTIGLGFESRYGRYGRNSPDPKNGTIDPGHGSAATITDAVDKKLASRLSQLEEQIHARMDDKVELLRADLKAELGALSGQLMGSIEMLKALATKHSLYSKSAPDELDRMLDDDDDSRDPHLKSHKAGQPLRPRRRRTNNMANKCAGTQGPMPYGGRDTNAPSRCQSEPQLLAQQPSGQTGAENTALPAMAGSNANAGGKRALDPSMLSA